MGRKQQPKKQGHTPRQSCKTNVKYDRGANRTGRESENSRNNTKRRLIVKRLENALAEDRATTDEIVELANIYASQDKTRKACEVFAGHFVKLSAEQTTRYACCLVLDNQLGMAREVLKYVDGKSLEKWEGEKLDYDTDDEAEIAKKGGKGKGKGKTGKDSDSDFDSDEEEEEEEENEKDNKNVEGDKKEGKDSEKDGKADSDDEIPDLVAVDAEKNEESIDDDEDRDSWEPMENTILGKTAAAWTKVRHD